MLPGIQAWSPPGGGQGAGAYAAPRPLRPLTPRWGQPSLTDNRGGTRGVPLASSLPRGSGRSASRCPARTRDERPSGVGASAPVGAAISSAPCRAYVNKRNRRSFFASATSSLDEGRERRLSLVESVHCAGKTVGLRGDCPRGGGRPCRMTCTLVDARRRGQVGTERGLFPFFFLALAGGCCPASGLGRLPAGGRGQGLAQPLAPYDPLPRVGVTIPDGQPGYASCTLASSLPRGSGRSASRCPAPTRDERPSGVGASAPFGAAISSAPCRAYVNKRNRRSFFASGTPSLDEGRERRLSFVESVHCAGKWDASSVVELVQRNKTGQASCRERICRRDDV